SNLFRTASTSRLHRLPWQIARLRATRLLLDSAAPSMLLTCLICNFSHTRCGTRWTTPWHIFVIKRRTFFSDTAACRGPRNPIQKSENATVLLSSEYAKLISCHGTKSVLL